MFVQSTHEFIRGRFSYGGLTHEFIRGKSPVEGFDGVIPSCTWGLPLSKFVEGAHFPLQNYLAGSMGMISARSVGHPK